MMKKVIVYLILLAVLPNVAVRGADTLAGQQLFTSKCASCHSVRRDAVGPALKDVDQRRTEAWIIKFVHSSQTVIKSGDTAAVRLFESRNKTIMPDHPDLTDDNIRNIIAYVKAESKKVVPAESSLVSATDYLPYGNKTSIVHEILFLDVRGTYMPLTSKDHLAWLVIAGLVIIPVVVFYIAVRSETILEQRRNEHTD